MKYKKRLENFFYTRIIRGLLFTSRLGRKSMMGYADSGINFDYIYRNVAVGYTRFGRIVDSVLLNLLAAQATINRKDTIVRILREEIDKNAAHERKTRIVDLASGPARYIAEAIDDTNKKYVEVLCLEIDRRSIEFGKRISLDKPILYKRANILKIGSRYKAVSGKVKWVPNLIMISGFIEYQEKDKLVLDLFNNIYKHLDDNGIVFAITQMGSPNRQLTERLGATKNGKVWKLHYRDTEILSRLLKESGFKNINIKPDRWNMYVYCRGEK